MRQGIVGTLLVIALAVIIVPIMITRHQGGGLIANAFAQTPPMPKIDRSFIPSSLSAKQVKAPQTNKDGLPMANAWVVQVNKFKQKKNAADAVAKLVKQGFSAYYMISEKQYKVMVGPFLQQAHASQAQKKLAKVDHINGELMAFYATQHA